MVFVFGSVYVVNYIYRLAYVEPALHPWDEADLIMVDQFFDVLLELLFQLSTENFHIDVHQGYWPTFCVVVASLPGCGIRMMLAS